MDNLCREIKLANGLVIKFFAGSRRYFGDFHHVTLEISCEVPITAELFEDTAVFLKAIKVFGNQLVYRRHVEQAGVPSAEIVSAVDILIANFLAHSSAYVSSPAFPQKLAAAELSKLQKKPAPFTTIHLHSHA
jgi:hypothetical protein